MGYAFIASASCAIGYMGSYLHYWLSIQVGTPEAARARDWLGVQWGFRVYMVLEISPDMDPLRPQTLN